MTKIETHYKFERPLDDGLMQRLADAHAVYGIIRLRLDPRLDGLTVEYDATRMRPADVTSTLKCHGLPVVQG